MLKILQVRNKHNFDRLDAENAQFRPEHRILHAKLCIYTYIYIYSWKCHNSANLVVFGGNLVFYMFFFQLRSIVVLPIPMNRSCAFFFFFAPPLPSCFSFLSVTPYSFSTLSSRAVAASPSCFPIVDLGAVVTSVFRRSGHPRRFRRWRRHEGEVFLFPFSYSLLTF